MSSPRPFSCRPRQDFSPRAVLVLRNRGRVRLVRIATWLVLWVFWRWCFGGFWIFNVRVGFLKSGRWLDVFATGSKSLMEPPAVHKLGGPFVAQPDLPLGPLGDGGLKSGGLL